MTTATEHYDRLLADQYTWMLGGDLGALVDEQTEVLRGLGVEPGDAGGIAVDLGCGSGSQTLALTRLGHHEVVAVDTCRTLLDELRRHARGQPGIRLRHTDLREVLPDATGEGAARTVVCMGDTLTHLPRKEDVPALLGQVARALAPGGQLVLGYRALTRELRGADRFLPVRSTEDRLLTCFLEYLDEDTVLVHDLLQVRPGPGGDWSLHASSYPKLRIVPEELAAQCREAGLEIRHDDVDARGMRLLHAVRP